MDMTEVEDGFQTLILEVDLGNAPQGGVNFEMEF